LVTPLPGLLEGYQYLVGNLESQVKTIRYEDLSARLMHEEKRMMGFEGRAVHETHDVMVFDPDTVMASGRRG